MATATQPTSPTDMEQKRARWRTPFVIAICAAALAGFVNLAVANINGTAQRDLVIGNADSQHQLKVEERQRQQREIIPDARNDARSKRGPSFAQSTAPCSPPSNVRAALNPKWLNGDCRYIFPGNDGFEGPITEVTLPPGTKIDRYGQPGGRYFAPTGTPYEARALPYDMSKMDYYQYEVLKPFAAAAGTTAAWFDQSGGGIQFRTTMSAQQLVAEGYLKEVKP